MKDTGCSRQKSDKRMEQLESGGMVEKRVRFTYARVKLSDVTTQWPEAPGSKKRGAVLAASACPRATSTNIAAARARR